VLPFDDDLVVTALTVRIKHVGRASFLWADRCNGRCANIGSVSKRPVSFSTVIRDALNSEGVGSA
jgi:hypothetical protein